jgi:hypothetical protein
LKQTRHHAIRGTRSRSNGRQSHLALGGIELAIVEQLVLVSL